VNLLTNLAVNRGKITIFGGAQKRPNIHLQDICDLYANLLELPDRMIAGKVFNAGHENATVMSLGERVKRIVESEFPDRPPLTLEVTTSNDPRSYHISSAKIERELGFRPRRTVEDAVRDLCRAFRDGKIPNPMEDDRYYNVRVLKNGKLS